MTEREIFIAALRADSSQTRATVLDQACAGDTELRARIESLLSEHEKLGNFMLGEGVEIINDPSDSGMVGDLIGPYRLLKQLGSGGMGVVFMAEQLRPVVRKVAIKVIKAGMDTQQVIARFEIERQTLALMEHANIARVLDAGATQRGRPYFVMELVHGVPITQYCDEHSLGIRERLQLFVSVCQAIQHAHQKGIIHRDIKPSNVMVTTIDGKPVPKVIDFGVAKATEVNNVETPGFTQLGTMIGTLEYMSPEQAGANIAGVDTRSDIYSLGVLLYELLSSTTPLSADMMRERSYAEILRTIREDDSPRPSARLRDSGESLVSIAARRSEDPNRLIRKISRELDWIALKSLEKMRDRRYASASSLADDVQRHLNDQPVQACPPSSWYRSLKFVRRNRLTIGAIASGCCMVLMTIILLAVSNSSIRREQQRTLAEKNRAERLQRLAEARAQEVRLGLERLKAANVALDQGRRYAGERHWDDARAAYTTALTLRPEHASAWQERGDLMAVLGLFDLANEDLAHEFELREPDGTSRWYKHALLYVATENYEEYDRVCRRMQERFDRTLTRDFAVELVRTMLLTANSDVDYRQLVHTAQHALDSEPASWYLMYLLGIAHYRNGDCEAAVTQLLASQSGGPSGPNQALSLCALAMAYHRLGQTVEARRALAMAAATIESWRNERYQARDPHTWVVHQGAVAHWPVAWWDWLEFEVYYREAMELIDGSPPKRDGRLHVLRARSLAGIHQHQGAITEYQAALLLMPNDTTVRAEAHRCAAYYALDQQQWNEAAREFASAIELSPDDTDLWRFRAIAQYAAGDHSAYQAVCEAMLDRFEHTTDWRVAGNVILACLLADQAVRDPERLIAVAKTASPWPHVGAYALGASQYRNGQYVEAIECFDATAELYRPQVLELSFLAMAHHRLGHLHEAQENLAAALKWLDEARRQTAPSDSHSQAKFAGWHEQIVFSSLAQEARTMIESHKEERSP